jgi:hypothetical protein
VSELPIQFVSVFNSDRYFRGKSPGYSSYLTELLPGSPDPNAGKEVALV